MTILDRASDRADLTARRDRAAVIVSVAASRRMYRDAPSAARLLVLPRDYGHGIDMLEGSWSSRAAKLVLDFLEKYSV